MRQWHPYEGGEVRLVVDTEDLPDDLHPDLYPEWFEFREKVSDAEDQGS